MGPITARDLVVVVVVVVVLLLLADGSLSDLWVFQHARMLRESMPRCAAIYGTLRDGLRVFIVL